MLDLKWIRENTEPLVAALTKRGWSEDKATAEVEAILEKDEARRAHLGSLQEKQERRNAASREIGNAMRAGDSARADALKTEVADIKEFIRNGEAEERRLDTALEDALAVIPNIPLDDVPVGEDEDANVEIRKVGNQWHPNWAKEHFEIGEALGFMDFERAAKLSGSRFTVLSGQLARLERALGQFMLDLHTSEHGYMEVQPPLLVRDDAMFGTGQLPKFGGDLFRSTTTIADRLLEIQTDEARVREFLNRNEESLSTWKGKVGERASETVESTVPGTISGKRDYQEMVADIDGRITQLQDTLARLDRERDELKQAGGAATSHRWLIPTAEVPLTNLVREEILEQDTLPLRFTALTPCFRSEAGAAGKDTRGMLRQHQFDKVELVSITDAETSIAEHERMTECAETVLKKLGLPFRTMVLSTGDMGFGARKTYDIEVWLPGQNAYREISSCSVCGDFQARRMNARYRDRDDRQTRFVHTLNGSGVAVGRALIAVLENYQEEDGSVAIPEVLHAYTGGMTKIEAARG